MKKERTNAIKTMKAREERMYNGSKEENNIFEEIR